MKIAPLRKRLRQALGLIFLIGVGLGLGMAVKAWAFPHLPRPLAHFFGIHPAAPSGPSAEEGGKEIAFWKSSMIPNFVSPRPGTDPMGMALIPVYKEELGEERLLSLSHETMQNIGLRTAPVVRGTAERMVRTVGQVDYAEPLLGDVTLKVAGWADKLYVTYVGQRVKKGQKLFSIYAPELVSAQEEYLQSLAPAAEGKENPFLGVSKRRARNKLLYWDVPEQEITALEKRGKTTKDITFVSRFDGWVIDKGVFEGMYMKPGGRFYRIADLSTMWVYVYIYEFQLAWVRKGQQARLTLPYDPGQVLKGKVIYVYPYVNPKTRQLRVRLEFPNPGLRLKADMYANVEIATASQDKQLLVPLDAVIYTGKHQSINGKEQRLGWAYVQVAHGKFEPHEVVMGEEVDGGRLQILAGLDEGMHVVVQGQFLLDCERKVKEANLQMFTGNQGKTPALTIPQKEHRDNHDGQNH